MKKMSYGVSMVFSMVFLFHNKCFIPKYAGSILSPVPPVETTPLLPSVVDVLRGRQLGVEGAHGAEAAAPQTAAGPNDGDRWMVSTIPGSQRLLG